MGFSRGSPVATHQTRICDYKGMERSAGDAALLAYAELYGRVERELFSEVAAGWGAASLEGKVSSVKE